MINGDIKYFIIPTVSLEGDLKSRVNHELSAACPCSIAA